MNTNAENRRQLAVSARAWALLVGAVMAVSASLLGLDTGEVVEAAVLGGLVAAICIVFFTGDILAFADRLTRRDRRPPS